MITLHLQKLRRISMGKRNLLFIAQRQNGLGCEKMGFDMSGAVILALTPRENPQHDIEQIASIYRNLSSAAAEQVVARALGELALSMAALAEDIADHQMGDLLRRLKRLDRMAHNLGLKTLSVVCKDLAICLERSDATGFAAVWARLLRVADCTLTFDQERQDLNGF
jgi:hypothetical protein